VSRSGQDPTLQKLWGLQDVIPQGVVTRCHETDSQSLWLSPNGDRREPPASGLGQFFLLSHACLFACDSTPPA
jgi:hypothetical protein